MKIDHVRCGTTELVRNEGWNGEDIFFLKLHGVNHQLKLKDLEELITMMKAVF